MSSTVLIVDDDPFVRSGLRALFESAGFGVCEAGSVRTAVQQCETRSLIGALVDIALPPDDSARAWSMNTEGIALVRMLKRRDPGLGIVLLSAYADHLDAVMDLLAEGVRGLAYRLKGRRADDLLDLLQRVCAGQIEIDPEVQGARPDLDNVLLERLSAAERPWVERAVAGLENLTPQESRVARLLAESYSPAGVAERLGIQRADGLIGRVYAKLGLADVADAAPQLRAISLLVKAGQIRDLPRKPAEQ